MTAWTREFDERILNTMLEMGVKPELEIYGHGGPTEIYALLEKIPLTKPYWIDFALDMQRTAQNVMPFTPKNLMFLVDQLPADSMFMTMGVGASEIQATVQSILLGGHTRVGMEDNLYVSKGVLAKSNAELVARIARIGTDLGRTVATPSEARELLAIPQLKA